MKALCMHCGDCEIAWNLWRSLKQGKIEPEFVRLQGKQWFDWNLSRMENNWAMVFGLGCWFLWGWRNRCLFVDGYVLPGDMSGMVTRYVKEIQCAKVEFGRTMGVRRETAIGWAAPGEG